MCNDKAANLYSFCMLQYLLFSFQKTRTVCLGRLGKLWQCPPLPSSTNPCPALSRSWSDPACSTAACGKKLRCRTGSCQAEPSPCPRSGNISQVEGNKPAICSRAEECSQLASSLFLGSDKHQHPVGGRLQEAARTMPGRNQRMKAPLQKTA